MENHDKEQFCCGLPKIEYIAYFGSKTPSNHQPRAVFIWVISWGYLEDTLTRLVGYIIGIPIVCDEKPNMLEILSINQQAHNCRSLICLKYV